jgi:hypothetical protein
MRGISASKAGRVVVGVCLLLAAGCQPPDAGIETNEQNEAEEAAPALPLPGPLPVADQPLDRAEILIAAAKAGSAAALGINDLADQRSLDGKTFEVRIRFGCAAGAGDADVKRTAPFNVRFDPSDRTLRVRATPDLTLDTPQVAVEGVEHVEGFWMRRPWLLTPGCPRGSSASDRDAPAKFEQRVGLAQLSTSTDDRTVRRDGRPYEATKVLEEGALPSAQGYDLVLSGRLKKLPGGRVIACRLPGTDVPPECVISAQFDRVQIQTPDGKTTLGDWRR